MHDDGLRLAARELSEDLVRWRRALHRRPELGFEERETAAFVERHLRAFGLDVRTGLAETGVVGILRAEDPAGPGILLRADMDALPVQEVEGREYGSEIPGKMHACGHDGHMAMLLGAASMLTGRRESLRRDVVFCFQPGEEGMGGAERMIDEGVLDLVEVGSVYGLHLWSGFPVGTAHVRPGPTMAAQDEFHARVIGKGGHGALPHTARDPIVAAAQSVIALQAIVSRSVDPVQPAVVTIGTFQAGSAPNVIPDDVRLSGTLRSFDETTRQVLRDRVREVLEGSAAAAGCRVELELQHGYPAVVNDPTAAASARRSAERVFGEQRVFTPDPMAAAEDFAYFLNARPGAFVFIGAGNVENGVDAPHHSPAFDIDEGALPHGAELLARLALEAD